jgi:Tol biopolymer transport system component
LGALLAVVAAISIWQQFRVPEEPGPTSISRFTFDSGVTLDPAISPDGKLAAYASDRAGKGNLDIWIQQFAGREPIQRTHHEADDHQPSFSPDGSRIAFRSERDGGGIYVMDALAGEERRIADEGFDPRFSPDGSQILYWEKSAVADIRLNKMHLIPSQGGIPKPFQPEFGADYPPVWSPDGKHVLFDGGRETEAGWWVAPADGGPAVSIGVPAFPDTSWASYFRPELWRGDQIIFLRGIAVEGINVFRTTLQAGAWRLSNQVQQITSGPGLRVTTAVAEDGRMLFPVLNIGMNLALVALNANAGTASGEPRLLTQDSTTKAFACLSRDATKISYVAYISSMPQRVELRIKDLQSGRETGVPCKNPSYTRLSREGSRLAYRDLVEGKTVSLVAGSDASTARQVCDGCTVMDFFADPNEMLVRYGGGRLVRQDFGGGRQIEILKVGAGTIVDAGLSEDGHWVSFQLVKPSGTSAIIVAPVRNTTVQEDEWITILEDVHPLGAPRWSLDGNLLYFLSERDGYCCVWAQRLTAGAKKPLGAPLGVYHDHRASANASLAYAPRGGAAHSLNISKDRLLWYQLELTSNIWQMQLHAK